MSALPTSLAKNPRLGQWLRFRAEGVVEVRSGKVELGQGILTTLAQIAAEELDVALERIAMVPAATGSSPDEGVTSGSLSTQDSGTALRFACAEARALCLEAAARRFGVSASSLRLADGDIHAADGRRTSYWEIGDAAIEGRDATASIAPKAADARRIAGRSVPRTDLADKVLGHARFIHDLALPGMLHGRVLRPPSPGATLASLDESAAQSLAGVAAVVRDGSFVGVVARSEAIASAAIERLRAAARWNELAALPDASRLDEWLRSAPRETTVVADRTAGGPRPARTLKASFTRPYLAHASVAPSCAIARWEDGALHVHTHAQGIYNLRADLAIVFAMPAERIVVEHVQGAGCYGHNGADDVALDAALLARAVDGQPVRVQWTRADELAWSPFGPAMAIDLEADLDDAGEVLAWRGATWSNGHTMRPGRAKIPTLLAASQLATPFERSLCVDPPFASGGGSQRNSVPGYDFPRVRVECHRVLEMPLRASALRSLGAFANVFAIEGFVDEIAHARGEDPLAWRLRHVSDPRARAVIESAARHAGWGSAQREGFGRGIGWARYKGAGAYCAVAAEVELTHEVRVRRLCIAIDVGFAVNPDGVANQVEGGAIQATSWTLKEAVRFDRTRVAADGWEGYPILTFSEVPRVEVEVLQRVDEPSVGAGEAAQGPTAAAIGNAVRDAIGVRIRDLPITAGRIAAAALAEETETA